MENKSILYIAAAKAYVKKLNKEMEPTMMAIFDDMWASVQDEPRRERLRAFQAKLRAVPTWNQYIISEHKARLVGEKNFPFEDLLTAVFVSRVKVLTAVRMASGSPDITVKVPSLDAFFHRAMFETAKRFYENPVIFKSNSYDAKRTIIHTGIDEAIEDLLPMKAILKAYVGNTVDEDANFTPRDDDASSKPDAFYSPAATAAAEPSPPMSAPAPAGEESDDDDDFLSRNDVIQKIEDEEPMKTVHIASNHQQEAAAAAADRPTMSDRPAATDPVADRAGDRAGDRVEELFSDAED
jgi:hypothetical protein